MHIRQQVLQDRCLEVDIVAVDAVRSHQRRKGKDLIEAIERDEWMKIINLMELHEDRSDKRHQHDTYDTNTKHSMNFG